MLFTLEPLMTDLFISNNVRCSFFYLKYYTIKVQQAVKKKKNTGEGMRNNFTSQLDWAQEALKLGQTLF